MPKVQREWLGEDRMTVIRPSESETFVFQYRYKEAKAKEIYKGAERKAYTLVYRQCSPSLKTKLEGAAGWSSANGARSIMDLLKLMKGFYCKSDSKTQGSKDIVESLKIVYLLSREWDIQQ